MGRALYRVGHYCTARPLIVLIAWIVLAAGLVGAMSKVGSMTTNDLTLPGTQSQQAYNLLAENFPPQQNGSNPIVFHVTKGKITDAANKNAVEASYKALLKAPTVDSATDPFGTASSALISTDSRTAFIPVLLKISNGQVTEDLAQRIFDATAPAQKQGIQVAAGGTIGCGNFDNGQIKLASGKSSTGCMTFLVPNGDKVTTVRYGNTVYPGTAAEWRLP